MARKRVTSMRGTLEGRETVEKKGKKENKIEGEVRGGRNE